jgi:hypothetical protein
MGANGNNDVTLLPSADCGNGADGARTVSANMNINTTVIAPRTYADGVNFSCVDNTAAGQNQLILNSATTNGLSTSGAGDEVMIINLAGNSPNTWLSKAAAPGSVASGGAMVSTGNDYIYAFPGNGSNEFWRYSISGNSWAKTLLQVAPGNVGAGGALVYPGQGDFIYAFQGGTTYTFWRYSISGNSWATMTVAPYTTGGVAHGGALASTGGDFIYGLEGNGQNEFARYSISAGTWTTMATTPGGVSNGGALVYPGTGDFIYAFRGSTTTTFLRYSISGNTWVSSAGSPTIVAPAPAPVVLGSALVSTGGDYIYAFRGNNTTDFWRYSISGNTWVSSAVSPTIVASALAAVTSGGNLVSTGGDYIYAFQGGTTTFWRYSISGNSWTTMTVTPGTIAYSATLVYPGTGDYIYAFQGGTTTFWRYSISGNSWTTMTPAPAAVASGGDLVSAGAFIYAFQGGTTAFWRYQCLGYAPSGSYISAAIAPTDVSRWNVLNYTIASPTNTTLTIDVLKSDNTPLVDNVTNGTNLGQSYSSTFTGISGIKLKANFASSNGVNTPTLSEWTINYLTGRIVTTAKWTSIVKNDRPVMIGHEVPVISWTAKADAGVAHWKSMRIRESGQQPVRVLDVAVYEESGNNGYWDKSDKLIAKGKFGENREVVLNMRQWPITITEKTYYITEKTSMDASGGLVIGIFIDNDSWLEFGDATCTGVPP